VTTWTAANLPRIRDDLVAACAHPLPRRWLVDHTDRVRHPTPGSGRINHADVSPDDIVRWLRTAELCFVTDTMSQVVAQAAADLPPYRLQPDDLPAPVGLVVWAIPPVRRVVEPTQPGVHGPWAAHAHIRAALWATTTTKAGPGVILVLFSDTDVLLASPTYVEEAKATGNWDSIEQLRAELGPLACYDAAPLVFADVPDTTIGNRPVAAALTTWILMGQRITVTTQERPSRQMRRQYAREGRPEPLVRSVTLRRAKQVPRERDHDGVEEPSGRRYQVQWPVRPYGYWRNTYYPSTDSHRPQYVWVDGYWKGDPDAPVVGGERVNVLRR
jgi:hypothetical protein